MEPDRPALSIRSVFLLLCLLCEGATFHVHGLEGGHVSFQCFHSYAWSNAKYLCRDPCKSSEDTVVAVESGQTAESGRFSLRDQGHVLTVNISGLQLSDQGDYYCGVSRVGFDTFIQVHLTVEEVPEPPTTEPPPPATTTTPKPLSSSSTFQYTQLTDQTGSNPTTGGEQSLSKGAALYVGLGAVALLATVVLAVIYFRKCRNHSKATAPVHLSNSDFIPGHKAVAHPESLRFRESTPPVSEGKTPPSSSHKQQPRRPKQRAASAASPRQPPRIYENVNFHKGATRSRHEAATVHEADDVCPIYNNV